MAGTEERRVIKCLAWDLDNTLWNGILLEDDQVELRPEAVEVIETLDSRGILHSIASRNNHDHAMEKLQELGLDHYFLYPQINWGSKAHSVGEIARQINIGLDAVAFIDDQPFERDEVADTHPEVMTIDAGEVSAIPNMPEMMPRFITDDSKIRRKMYQADVQRNQAESQFVGPTEEFLAKLGMVFRIAPAQEEDLKRAEELTVRTHQLNTTGYTYSYEELNAIRHSPDHRLFIASLDDRYGTYGKIGLALVECGEEIWNLKLLLMSCRVMSRGVGTILVNHILRLAREAGAKLRAEFVRNDRNRMMYTTYKFGGFKEIGREGDALILEHDLADIQPFPEYVDVQLG
jgi:FkbH-like protein